MRFAYGPGQANALKAARAVVRASCFAAAEEPLSVEPAHSGWLDTF